MICQETTMRATGNQRWPKAASQSGVPTTSYKTVHRRQWSLRGNTLAAAGVGLTAVSVGSAAAESTASLGSTTAGSRIPIWVLGIIAALAVLGAVSWIRFIRSGGFSPVYLSRRHLPDLRRCIEFQLGDLRSQGIPDRYLDRYKKLAYLDYSRYRKGLGQLVKDMRNDEIDVTPLVASVQRIRDASAAW
jgi:hypothetical protein